MNDQKNESDTAVENESDTAEAATETTVPHSKPSKTPKPKNAVAVASKTIKDRVKRAPEMPQEG